MLDIADAVFQERGYHATSLADVVAAAGVTGGALHHHFASKKALGLAVVWERVAPEVERTWADTMAAAPSARAGVRQVFLDVAEALERQGFVRGCPLNNLALELSLADPEFRVAIAGIFQAWRVLIARRFKDDQRVGREDYARRRRDVRRPDDRRLFGGDGDGQGRAGPVLSAHLRALKRRGRTGWADASSSVRGPPERPRAGATTP